MRENILREMRHMTDEQLRSIKIAYCESPCGTDGHRIFLEADRMLRGKENIYLGRTLGDECVRIRQKRQS